GNKFPGWGWNQIVARDDTSFWFATAEGIVRWPKVHRIEDFGAIQPLAIYTTRDGLDSDDIFRVWRDSRGRIWAGTFGKIAPLSRFEPNGKRFVSFGLADGLPYAAPTAFAEDRAGNIWIGLYIGGVIRFRSRDAKFEYLTRGLPTAFVRDLKIDSKGRLWIGATGGVARIEDPTADAQHLSIKRFTRSDGFAADSGYCFAELPDGRMAIGAQRGVDILDLTN